MMYGGGYAGRASFPVGTWETRFVFDAAGDDETRQVLEALCEGYTLANMVWFRANPWAPCCLREAGVQYVPPQGCALGGSGPCQTVRGAAEVLRGGVATCIDIAPYYAANLRMRGIPARVVAQNMLDQNGRPISGQYHILVATPRGVRDYSEELREGRHPRCAADCNRPVRRRAAGAHW